MSRIVSSTDIGSALRSRQRGFLLNPFRFGGGGGGGGGTLTRTNVGQYPSSDGHGTGSFSSGSFTPADNSLLVVAVFATSASSDAFDGADITLTDSAGLTWTARVATPVSTPNWAYGTRVFSAPVTTGTSMTVTADAGAFSIQDYRIEVYQYTNYNTSTPVGATAAANEPGGADVTLTLSGTPAATSEILAFANSVLSSGTSSATPGTGWTELFDVTLAGWFNYQSQVRLAGSTLTSVLWADVATGGGVDGSTCCALEIRQAP